MSERAASEPRNTGLASRAPTEPEPQPPMGSHETHAKGVAKAVAPVWLSQRRAPGLRSCGSSIDRLAAPCSSGRDGSRVAKGLESGAFFPTARRDNPQHGDL